MIRRLILYSILWQAHNDLFGYIWILFSTSDLKLFKAINMIIWLNSIVFGRKRQTLLSIVEQNEKKKKKKENVYVLNPFTRKPWRLKISDSALRILHKLLVCYFECIVHGAAEAYTISHNNYCLLNISIILNRPIIALLTTKL